MLDICQPRVELVDHEVSLYRSARGKLPSSHSHRMSVVELCKEMFENRRSREYSRRDPYRDDDNAERKLTQVHARVPRN